MKNALLIQIRKNKKIADDEYNSFSRIAKKAGVSLDRINVCYHNLDISKVMDDYDGIIIGGSALSVKDNFSQKDKVKSIILSAVGNKKPFLGVCFGFQLLSHTLGGNIVHDKENKEFATKEITIAEKEKIFSEMKDVFYAQEAHEWRASDIPEDTIVIAKGKDVEIQGIKVLNAPAYGVQFHPELTDKDMIERMNYYNSFKNCVYKFDEDDFRAIKESQESEKVIYNFLKYC
jgi:GMP synthase (glutamine-hydrolysing)